MNTGKGVSLWLVEREKRRGPSWSPSSRSRLAPNSTAAEGARLPKLPELRTRLGFNQGTGRSCEPDRTRSNLDHGSSDCGFSTQLPPSVTGSERNWSSQPRAFEKGRHARLGQFWPRLDRSRPGSQGATQALRHSERRR